MLTASQVSFGSPAFSSQSLPSCSCTSPQAPQRLILPIRQPTIVRTARAASALSAAQDVGTARLPCTAGHSITSSCAADYPSKAHLKSLSPPVLVTFNTRPLPSFMLFIVGYPQMTVIYRNVISRISAATSPRPPLPPPLPRKEQHAG